MKFSKLDLLTLLISLFLFASCNESSTIGLDLDPNNAIQGKLVDSLIVSTKTVADDAAVTYLGANSQANPTRLPLGFLTDPVFGTTEASLAFSVNVPANSYSFGLSPTIDSAVLVLPYASNFYGDTTTTDYNVKVTQLSNDLSVSGSFLSTNEYASLADAGSFTGKIKPNTVSKVTEIVAGKPDTIRTFPPSLRIKLDNAFIESNIIKKDASVLLNNATFNNSFRGLKVSTTVAGPGTGGMMFFNFNASAGARVDIYYKKQNATTVTERDTTTVTFPISQSVNPVAATIKHNYAGTLVDAQLKDATNQQFDITYLQGLAGLRNKISFPDLKNFTKNLGAKIVINKAELVVDISPGTDVAPFNPAQRLALYQYDIAGQRAFIPDQNTSNMVYYKGNFGTGYNISNKNYTFIVTGLIQNLIDGKIADNGIYLAPAPALITEYGINSPLTTAARSVIGSFGNGKKVKLNIYYTKIN